MESWELKGRGNKNREEVFWDVEIVGKLVRCYGFLTIALFLVILFEQKLLP